MSLQTGSDQAGSFAREAPGLPGAGQAGLNRLMSGSLRVRGTNLGVGAAEPRELEQQVPAGGAEEDLPVLALGFVFQQVDFPQVFGCELQVRS
jgi:hypothetical protein